VRVNYIEQVESRLGDHIERDEQSVAHRMDHIQRVRANARAIARHYEGVDLELLDLGALLHDVRQPYDDKKNHVAYSADLARQILLGIGYDPARIDRVVGIIEEHSTEHVEQVAPSSIEAKILFDADKLDGLGASGILRVFALFRQMGKSVEEAIPWYRRKIDIARRHMQTPEGRSIAEERLALVKTFLATLESELAAGRTPSSN
jgi:uncharacterized protein